MDQEELGNRIARLNCCNAQLAYKSFKANQYNAENKACLYNNVLYLQHAINALNRYIIPGTIIEEAQISSATLSLSTLSIGLPALINAEVDVNGTVIGSISVVCNTLTDVLNALEGAIDGGGSGYTASVSGTDLIVYAPPGTGSTLNGLVVTLTVDNYYFIENGIALDVISPESLRGACNVNNIASLMNGWTFIAGYDLDLIFVVDYTNQIPTNIFPSGIPTTSDTNFCIYSPITDKIYAGENSVFGYDVVTCTSSAPTFSVANTAAPQVITSGMYNPIDTFVYLASVASTNVYKLDNNAPYGIISTIATGILAGGMSINTNPDTSNVRRGDIWILGPAGAARVINTSGALAASFVSANNSQKLIYCPPIDRMLIYNTATTNIDSWNPNTFALDTAGFITVGSVPNTMFYSEIFNKIFIETTVLGVKFIKVYNTDGTLITPISEVQTLISNNGTCFLDDVNGGAVIRIHDSVSAVQADPHNVDWINVNQDIDSFSGPLLNGTPEVLQTEEDNCLDEEEFNNLLEVSASKCCDCCESDSDLIQDI